MKIRCDKETLLKGVQVVQNVVSTRTTLPILSNILLETQKKKLYLAGTDLDVGIATYVEVDVEETAEGLKTLYNELISQFNGDVGMSHLNFYNRIISLMNSDLSEWGTSEDYASMSNDQKAVFQAIKRFYKRLPTE